MFNKLYLRIWKGLQIYIIFSSGSNLTEIRKFNDEIESHVRYLDSLNVKSDSYSALLVLMIMGKLPPQSKLALSRNLKS